MKKYLLTLICTYFFPTFALAFGESESPVSKGLGWLISQATGKTGIAIATLAVMAVGLLCLGRVFEWKSIIYTVAGIAVLFGAGSIVYGIKTLVAT